MDFNFSEDLELLRQSVREFADSEIKPLAASIDINEEVPRELIKKIAEMGLLGTGFPEKYNGGGFGETGYCIAQEEVTKACGSTAALIGAQSFHWR